ncbi:MAG TPA: hypothetical protein VFJ95_03125, partial [Gammaproteobacteria bacterium]|nr:hypothetical protein [Gammaproteobacteria bacterium]
MICRANVARGLVILSCLAAVGCNDRTEQRTARAVNDPEPVTATATVSPSAEESTAAAAAPEAVPAAHGAAGRDGAAGPTATAPAPSSSATFDAESLVAMPEPAAKP